MSSDDAYADGIGTIDDPFHGNISRFDYDRPGTYYILLGSEIEIELNNPDAIVNHAFTIESGHGLEIVSLGRGNYALSGTPTSTGEIVVYDDGEWCVTFIVVEQPSFQELEFLSDPVADGEVSYVAA